MKRYFRTMFGLNQTSYDTFLKHLNFKIEPKLKLFPVDMFIKTIVLKN